MAVAGPPITREVRDAGAEPTVIFVTLYIRHLLCVAARRAERPDDDCRRILSGHSGESPVDLPMHQPETTLEVGRQPRN